MNRDRFRTVHRNLRVERFTAAASCFASYGFHCVNDGGSLAFVRDANAQCRGVATMMLTVREGGISKSGRRSVLDVCKIPMFRTVRLP